MIYEDDVDYCEVCECVIKEGREHIYWKHGSTKESAAELKAWRRELEATGEHHK